MYKSNQVHHTNQQIITTDGAEIDTFPDRFRSIGFDLNDNDCYNLMFTKKYWCPKK